MAEAKIKTEAEAIIERLRPLCLEDSAISEPFGYVRNGIRYVGATDNRLLVLIKSDVELAPPKVPIDKTFINYEPGKPVEFNKLVEFAGPAQFEQECSKCRGHGSCRLCSETCSDCDGVGTIEVEVRPGRIGAMALNLNFLARALAAVSPVETCELTVAAKYGRKIDSTPPIYITAPDWMILVMPMKSCESDVPYFAIT